MINKIGLFDSGVGGLTVLREMVQHFPEHSFSYLGDTARLPYGTKSPQTLKKYIQQNIDFLKGEDVDLVISACHTASSAMLKYHLKDDIPLFEVVTPSCEEAVKTSKTGHIGLLGTISTVSSDIYPQTLKKISPDIKVYQQSSPMLVPLVENSWIHDPITDEILKRYLTPLLEKNIDSLILGCTHFPLLAEPIAKICGPSVSLIDPAKALAKQLAQKFCEKFQQSQNPQIDVFLTDHSPHFLEHSRNLMGESIGQRVHLQSPDIT